MTKRKIPVVFLLLLLTLSSQLLMACATSTSQLAQNVPTITLQPTSTKVQSSPAVQTGAKELNFNLDYTFSSSLEELVAKSPIVLIGQMSATEGYVNTERNNLNLDQPSTQVLALGQIYVVTAERYLKGNSTPSIKVIQAEAYFDITGGNPTPDQIARAKVNFGAMALRSGVKYLFFLQPITPVGELAGKGYYVGAVAPWRFSLPNTGSIKSETSIDRTLLEALENKTTNDLITQMEAVISRNPTLTPVPTSPPKPTARAKASDAINLVKLYNLDKAVYVRAEWHNAKPLEYKDPNTIRSILNVLDTPITTVERTTPPGSKVENYAIIYFGFSDDTWISFGYYREEGVFRNGSFDLSQKLMIPVPTKLAEVLGLPPLIN
jgi:hypothetical protein